MENKKENPVRPENNIELRSEEFHEVLGAVPPWILRWGITAVAGILAILIVGSCIFRYPDTISTSMTLTGAVPPAAIIARNTGKLKELRVADNQSVNAGQYIAVIENPADTEDILYLKNFIERFDFDDPVAEFPRRDLSLGSLQDYFSSFYTALYDYSEFLRLDYYARKKEVLSERIERYRNQYSNLKAQYKIIIDQHRVNSSQFSRDSMLYSRQILLNEEYENSYMKILDSRMSVENIKRTMEDFDIQINQMNESMLDLDHQHTESSNNYLTRILSTSRQIRAALEDWELSYCFVAPIDGKITFTGYWTENQNVTVGETAFNIVPHENSELIGKAVLPMAHSGKVRVGQKVNIRFDNFPDNEFGIVKGMVANISLVPYSENSETNYMVEITLPEGLLTTYKHQLPYMPEMQAQADIITNNISFMQRMLMPLRKVWTEALSD